MKRTLFFILCGLASSVVTVAADGASVSTLTNPPSVVAHTNLAIAEKARAKIASDEDNDPPLKLPGIRIPAPPGMTIEWDVEYLAPGRKEKADLYLPTNSPAGKPRAAVLVMHGGGFNDGDKARPREINFCTNLAAQGYVCMSINYKLSRSNARDQATWPQNLHDAKTAVRWLRKNAKRLDIDPSRIAAMGGSAGGNLAAMLATTGPKDGLEPAGPYPEFSTQVSCAVDFYGAVKLRDYHDMKMFAKTRAEAPELYDRASPVTYVGKDSAPIFIAHGTADQTVDLKQSEALAAAYQKAGAECVFITLPGAPHTFNLTPKQRDLRPDVFAFLKRHLDPPATTISAEQHSVGVEQTSNVAVEGRRVE